MRRRLAKQHDPAEIAAPRLLVSLDLPNPFANAIALGLCEGSRMVRNSFESPLPEISPPRYVLEPQRHSPCAHPLRLAALRGC